VRPATPNVVHPDSANTELPWHSARQDGDLNLICMTGFMGNDPLLEKTFTKGADFCLVRLACHEVVNFRTPGIPDREYTNWVSFIAYGALARAVVSRYYKGCAVFIKATFRTDEFVGHRKNGKQSRITRETKVIQQIRLLYKPKHEKPIPAPANLMPEAIPVAGARKSGYRRYVPDPGDDFINMDEEAMPTDAKEPEA